MLPMSLISCFNFPCRQVELLDEYMVSLARTMEGKNAIFWKVVTKTQEEIEFASGGQPGELVSVPMPHHFPLLIVPKEARPAPHVHAYPKCIGSVSVLVASIAGLFFGGVGKGVEI